MTRERSRRIIITSVAGAVQRVVQLTTTLITIPLVLHTVGVAGFGIWGAVVSLTWLSGMLDLGIASALVSLVPRAIATNNTKDARAYVTAALCGGTVLSLAVLVLDFATLAALGGRSEDWPFAVAVAALAVNIPLNVSVSIWLGLQKGYVNVFWELVQSFLTFGFLILGTTIGVGVIGLVAAVYCAMVVASAGRLVHLLLTYESLRPKTLPNWSAFREVLGRGSLLFGITLAASCAYVFDNTMALGWLGPVASAQMTIALRICTTGSGILTVISMPFWPAFAEAAALGDRQWMWRTLRVGALSVSVLAVLGSLLIVVFGTSFMRWWLRQDLELSRTLFWTMAAWITITTLPLIPGFLLNSVLRLRPQLLILSTVALLGLLLKFLAAKTFGVAGILAVSPALVLVLVWPTYLLLVRSWFVATNRSGGSGVVA